MNQPTLFLIQASYAGAPHAFDQLKQMASAQDQTVLMGEAVMHAAALAQQNMKFYVLETEQALLAGSASAQFSIISYDEFAALCLQFSRIVTLK